MSNFLKATKINHKLVAIVFGAGVLSFSIVKVIDFFELSNEIKNTNIQIESYKKEIVNTNNKLNQNISKSNVNSDLSYYASNIYAYCLLEDIEVEIKNGPSKYKDSLQLIIVHKELEKQKHQNFLNALSLMGFIEDVKKDGFVLNVYEYSISDAKNEIQKIISK